MCVGGQPRCASKRPHQARTRHSLYAVSTRRPPSAHGERLVLPEEVARPMQRARRQQVTEAWAWCRRCQRAWEAAAFRTVHLRAGRQECCPDWECDGAGRGADLWPYAQTRARRAAHWPAQPAPGQRLTLPS